MKVSIKEFAKRKGVSYQAIHKAIVDGRLTRDEDGLIDFENGLKELEQNSGIRYGAEDFVNNEEKIDGFTYSEARTKNEVLRAEINKLKIAQLNEELIEIGVVKQVFFKKVREFRDALQNWPARVASQIASELGADPHTTNVVLDRYIYEFLYEISEQDIELKPTDRRITSLE